MDAPEARAPETATAGVAQGTPRFTSGATRTEAMGVACGTRPRGEAPQEAFLHGQITGQVLGPGVEHTVG